MNFDLLRFLQNWLMILGVMKIIDMIIVFWMNRKKKTERKTP